MNEQEIQALIALLDDSDREVFDHVSSKLLSLGPQVIEKLEDAYTSIPDPLVQERIEIIIHQIQFEGIEKDILQWSRNESDNLLEGVLIVTRHQYPELNEEKVNKFLSRVKKDIWIGLNHYLSPLEQMNVVNQTLFGHYSLTGNNNTEQEQSISYLNNVIETSKGNHFSLGLLYLTLCQQLEMPVYGVCLSSHFILVRTKDYIVDFNDTEKLKNDILFYVNPFNKGLAFSEREINIYLKKLELDPQNKYFLPASNTTIIKEYISFLSKFYSKPDEHQKANDLNRLSDLISD
ncbi:MAG: transglutaminase-like domain-containing protein [Chitinophagales bacterium]